MPFPNFHAARIRPEGRFERFATQKNQGGDGVDFILGIRADDGSEIQSIRFDRTKFTVAQARKWLADHDFSPILFEEATGGDGVQEAGHEDEHGSEHEDDVDEFDGPSDAPKLENEILNLREKDFPKGRCGLCRYFVEPNVCKILEGPVAVELVCDGFQGIEEGFPPYEVRDEDWLDFVNGMVNEQPYQHIVVAGHLTPEGPIVIIKDTIKPKPHIFSLSKKFHIGHTSTEHHWTQEDVDQFIEAGRDMAESILEGIRPAFGSPGGKKLLAQNIVKLIPEHKVYVEPFSGAAAVFFAKEPSESEVLNDSDSEIAEAFKFIKENTEADRKKLLSLPMERDRKVFERLKASSPGGLLENFHRFLYLNAFSMGNTRDGYADGVAKTIAHKVDRMDRLAERLKGVQITSKDFRDVIAEHDGPDTFFYLDPPYPTQQGTLKTNLKTADIVEAVKKIRGKFMLSLPDDLETRRAFRGFEIKKVSVRRTMNMANPHVDGELLIANFWMKPEARLAASVSEMVLDIVGLSWPFLLDLPDRGAAYFTEKERLAKTSP